MSCNCTLKCQQSLCDGERVFHNEDSKREHRRLPRAVSTPPSQQPASARPPAPPRVRHKRRSTWASTPVTASQRGCAQVRLLGLSSLEGALEQKRTPPSLRALRDGMLGVINTQLDPPNQCLIYFVRNEKEFSFNLKVKHFKYIP